MQEPIWGKFAAGALAGSVAEMVTTPFEVIKTRAQLSSAKAIKPGQTIATVVKIVRLEGVNAVFKGLTPGIARQVVYCGGKLTVYEPIRTRCESVMGTGIASKLLSGAAAGGLGNFFSTPADLMKVRFQADPTGSVAQRGLFRNWVDCLAAEGVQGLWRGCTPTVCRALAINSVELGCYDMVKVMLTPYFSQYHAEDVRIHFMAGAVAGLMASVASLPFDVVKSRLMVTGSQYNGVVDCLSRTVRAEGTISLMRGFVRVASRIIPFNIVQFMLFEQARRLLYRNTADVNDFLVTEQ